MRPTLHNAALLRPKCRHFRLTPSDSTGIRPALYDDALLRLTRHHIRTACRLYRLVPCFARYNVRKRKIYSPAVMRRIRPSAKFNREPFHKKQEPSKAERPIKFYAEK